MQGKSSGFSEKKDNQGVNRRKRRMTKQDGM